MIYAQTICGQMKCARPRPQASINPLPIGRTADSVKFQVMTIAVQWSGVTR